MSGFPLFGNQILSYPNIIYNIDRDFTLGLQQIYNNNFKE